MRLASQVLLNYKETAMHFLHDFPGLQFPGFHSPVQLPDPLGGNPTANQITGENVRFSFVPGIEDNAASPAIPLHTPM